MSAVKFNDLKAKAEKKYGEFAFTARNAPDMRVTSTGVTALDFATGIGGLPAGRMVEMWGPESVGKTALSYMMIAEHIRKGHFCGFINLEPGFDYSWFKKITGLSDQESEQLLVVNPEPGTEATHQVHEWVLSGALDFIVFDSVGNMLTDKEQELGSEKQVAGQTALITNMVKQLARPAAINETTVLFLNQIRDNLAYAGTPKPPGGHAIKHNSTIRINLKRASDVRIMAKFNGDEIQVGFGVAAQIIKNKAGAADGRGYWNFYQRPLSFVPNAKGVPKPEIDPAGIIGFDNLQSVVDLSINNGVIKQGGAYYTYKKFPIDKKGEPKIYTKDATVDFVRQNEDIQKSLWHDLMLVAADMAPVVEAEEVPVEV